MMKSFSRSLAVAAFSISLMGIPVPGISQKIAEKMEAEAEPKAKEEKEKRFAGKVVVVRITNDDITNGRRLRDLERVVEAADQEKAIALVYDIDLTAPASVDSGRKLIEIVSDAEVPTVAFVNTVATGVGAMVALSSDAVYMKDSAIVGSVVGVGSRASDDEDEKSRKNAGDQQLSLLKARARGMASKHGHDVAVAEAFVENGADLKKGEELILEKGEVLTLTADEAVRKFGGEPLFAQGIAGSVAEVVRMEKLKGEVIETSPRQYGEHWNRDRLSRSDSRGKDEEESFESEGIFGRRDSENLKDAIVILEIGEDALATGEARFDFMDRILKKAELDGAEAIILDIDTPGGYAWYTQGLVLDSLQNLSIPTYSFVNTKAESAGAIIAVGTDEIYMRPAATIGSALVVSGTGADLAESMNDKVTQMVIATVRNVAELKGHNPDVAEAFVTQDKEVKIDGVVIHESGKVLNLNTVDATEEIGGRPVLAKGVAASLDDLIEQEGLKGKKLEAAPLGMESFAHTIQKFSFILIIIGVAGAYMEYNAPGFGLPGLVSVAAFSLFFFGNYLAGNLAGYELGVLFVVGLVLIGVEIFLFPGALLPGVIGGLLVVTSLGLGMVDRVDFEWKWTGLPTEASWGGIFRSAMWSLAFGLVGGLLLIFVLMRFLPESKMGNWMVLQGAVPGGASLEGGEVIGEENADSPTRTLLGRKGEATTDLRPAGKGRFDEDLFDIISDGEFIPKGEAIQVAKHEGSRIVVRRIS